MIIGKGLLEGTLWNDPQVCISECTAAYHHAFLELAAVPLDPVEHGPGRLFLLGQVAAGDDPAVAAEVDLFVVHLVALLQPLREVLLHQRSLLLK